jgi:hypothetical protein
MHPYLQSRDLLWIESVHNFSLLRGQLVYGIINESGAAFVHRVISQGLIKGDRSKQPDNDRMYGVTVLGVVKGKLITSKGAGLTYISYERRWIRWMHRLQASISLLNQWKYPILHKFATLTLIVLGTLTRKIEEQFSAKFFEEKV